MEEQDLLLLQVWPLQQEDFLLMVPQTFRRNPQSALFGQHSWEELPEGAASLWGWKRDQCGIQRRLELYLELPQGSQGRFFFLSGEAETCLAISPPPPRTGTAARSLPGNLYTIPDKEIKGTEDLAK